MLLQKKTPIGRTDTLGTVYFDRLFPMGVDAMMEVGRPGEGRQGAAHQAGRVARPPTRAAAAPTTPGSTGASRGSRSTGSSAAAIRRPAPGRTLDGKQLKIFDAKPLPAKDPKGIAGKTGEIAAVEADGFTVVCADGRFKVTRVQPADGKKIEAGEWAKSANLAVKARFYMTPLTSSRRRRDPVITRQDVIRDARLRGHDNRTHYHPHDWIAPMPASQHQSPKSDIEISQSATKRRILDIAKEKLGIAPEHLDPYGHYKAKVSVDYIKSLKDKKNGKLILVTAISPTPAGEGKTTTTVGLTDALNHIGKKAMLCLREPSLGPSFGMKGGAAGGGYAQVDPDGGHQPPLHRRLPRHHLGAQSALGADRQPHLLGQRARHRLRAASPGAASWT